jgi:hypothetical protein
MNSFYAFFPDADELAKKSPDEVGPVLLGLALARLQPGGGFHLGSVTDPSLSKPLTARCILTSKKPSPIKR